MFIVNQNLWRTSFGNLLMMYAAARVHLLHTGIFSAANCFRYSLSLLRTPRAFGA